MGELPSTGVLESCDVLCRALRVRDEAWRTAPVHQKVDIHLLCIYRGNEGGLIPAQLSPPSNKMSSTEYERKLSHIMKSTGAQGVFVDEQLANQFEFGSAIVLTPNSQPVALRVARPRVHDIALVQFSSGSTGLQKGVAMSHSAVASHMDAYVKSIRLHTDDRVISWLPLYHDMGLIACFLMPLMSGIPFYQMDPFDWIMRPDLLLEAIEVHGGTICYLPNFAYHVLINKCGDHDLSSMRMFINCSDLQAQLPMTV